MPDAVALLLEKLKSTENGVIKASIIENLGRHKDPRALQPLMKALSDPDALVRWNTILALSSYGEEASVTLLKALEAGDPHLRRNIVQVLGEIGGEHVTERLIRMLMFDETDKAVLIETIRALQKIGTENAIEPLLTVLKVNDWEMKWRAVHALGHIGSPRAMEPMLEILNDNDPDLQWAANVAIENITKQSIKKEFEAAAGTVADTREIPPVPTDQTPKSIHLNPSDLNLSAITRGYNVCVVVTGELNISNAQIFKGFLEGVISTTVAPVEIDMSKCDFIDSFALSTLNSVRKKLKTKKRSLKLLGLNPRLKAVFTATHLNTLFDIEK